MTDTQPPIDLPPWIASVAADPVYAWAVGAWRRAAAYPGAWFDAAKADRIVTAWPQIFRLTDDRFFGLPFRLLPWQEIIVRLLVGWKRPSEQIDPLTHRLMVVQVRLFRRLDLWISRKNGKSEFLAALGVLFFALERVQKGQGYVFAKNEDQGRIPFGKMQTIIEQAPNLEKAADGTRRIDMMKRGIHVRETGSLCELLTGKPGGKHGKSPTMILGDEIHEWTTRELADTLRQGTGSRLQPIELYASTAGIKTALVGWKWYEESVGIARGEIDDPTTLAVVFSLDEDDDWTDERNWARANPSIGLTPTWDFLRGEYRQAKGRPAQEARFRAYHLGQWVDSVSSWIPRAKWKANTTADGSWRDLAAAQRGRRCFGALDVSAKRDITALVWLFPPDEVCDRWVIVPRFWIPEARLEERAQEDRRFDWRRMVAIGAMETTPGDVVDQAFVQAAIGDGLSTYAVEAVGYDPWNAIKLMTDLQADGMAAELQVEIRQGHRSLAGPTASFEEKVFKAEFEHGGHPVLAWMAGNAVVRFDANLNYVPSKIDSRDKIDGIAATVMALTLAERVDENPAETTISIL